MTRLDDGLKETEPHEAARRCSTVLEGTAFASCGERKVGRPRAHGQGTVTKHGGIPMRRALPERPWLVHVVRSSVLAGPMPAVWSVWCPCCRQWSGFFDFSEAVDAVRDILPGVR